MRVPTLLWPSSVIAAAVHGVACLLLWDIPLSTNDWTAATMEFGSAKELERADVALMEPDLLEDAVAEPCIPEEDITEEETTESCVDAEDGSVGFDADLEESAIGLSAFMGPSTSAGIGLGGGGGGEHGGRSGHRRATRCAGLYQCAWERSRLVPHTSKLQVGDQEELPLEKMHVQVRIDGFRARVVLDCFYRNDRDRRLEGTFKLRLPNDASPYFFAFGETTRVAAIAAAKPQAWGDLAPAALLSGRGGSWSMPKVARMVPRERAVHAYTETRRRRVDPALLEWAGAGVFHARVFPLMPGKLHRIVLAYDVSLTEIGEGLEYRLELPERIPDFAVYLKTSDLLATVTPPGEIRNRPFVWRNPKTRTFTVRIRKPGAIMLRGRDAESGPYFAARFRPELPAAQVAGNGRAVFLVDTSLSSNPERFRVWLKLLGFILANNRDELNELAVVFFNIERFSRRHGFQPNTAANIDALLAFADAVTLEGATDLSGALHEIATLDADSANCGPVDRRRADWR